MFEPREPDPVDLMMDGRFEEAQQTYLHLYVEALKRGDLAIGPDLIAGLHYCIAGATKSRNVLPGDYDVASPETVSSEVEEAVVEELREHQMDLDKRVSDQLQMGRAMVSRGKRRAERSVERVETEKHRRWSRSKE